MLIFFGDDAPAELHDMSVLHRATVAEDGPQPGDTVTSVTPAWRCSPSGRVVRDNLLNLGHLDLKADGRTEAKLPGDVCVPKRSRCRCSRSATRSASPAPADHRRSRTT